jgi:protoporphyrinogen oxidase
VTAILGAGVTGLAAASMLGGPVFEQADGPGGICRSYYIRPGDRRELDATPPDGEAYRFEIGGGHWIFGGDPVGLEFISGIAPLRSYERRAVVHLGKLGLTVPYPLQAHVEDMGADWVGAVSEMGSPIARSRGCETTMGAWLVESFGQTLSDLFFLPFHDRYTAGLTHQIAPQDGYKSPPPGRPQGYNSEFYYPIGGIDGLARQIAESCDVVYGKQVVEIDTGDRTCRFADGTRYRYDTLVSTLPLSTALELAGVVVDEPSDPYTSVLVLNIGAERAVHCPAVHWQYEPDSKSGFHRIGFYSNVESDFLPASRRGGSHVSLYVERAFPGGVRPTNLELDRYTADVLDELVERQYIGRLDVVHASWVDVAYTWRWPDSSWREEALSALSSAGIEQVGRYGRWVFQGIAESIGEGILAGSRLRERP